MTRMMCQQMGMLLLLLPLLLLQLFLARTPLFL
jgi:hypothetical protein